MTLLLVVFRLGWDGKEEVEWWALRKRDAPVSVS